MQKKHQPEFEFDLTGGHLALDLANTVSRRDDPVRRREHLESYRDLLAFAKQSGVVSPKQITELRGYAERHETEARQSFRRAIDLREALYRAFSTIAQEQAAAEADIRTINDFAVEALQYRYLARANGAYHWEWKSGSQVSLDRVLWAAARAAAELLTSEQLKIVRFCEAPDCQWLFLDHSRNRSRRWCDMTSCGNRAKARRHYQRTHE